MDAALVFCQHTKPAVLIVAQRVGLYLHELLTARKDAP